MVGSIYLARIFFTDGQSYKIRPILIVQKNSFGDFIYIPFTTNSNNKNSMKFSNKFLKSGDFKKDSYLILDKTCTIQPKLLDKEIAIIKDDVMNQVLNKYCLFLKTPK